MKPNTANKGCKSSSHYTYQQKSVTCTIISGFSSYLKSVQGTFLIVLAAFACSCIKVDELCSDMQTSDLEQAIILLKNPVKEGGHNIDRVDIFTFNCDSLERLDSYQKLDDVEDDVIEVSSTTGQKKIFVCCNLGMTDDDIIKIGSIRDLEEYCCRLENVRRSAPMMMGVSENEAGSESRISVSLEPLTSSIILRSISCRFNGTPYEGEPITGAKVYLTNVNAECQLSGFPQSARRFVNMGMLNMNDMEQFTEPDIIVQSIGDIRENRIQTDISLICFHNYCEDESMGSPYTRLVVEGKIQGETYYWPVAVNRTNNGEGIRNNTRHVFDIIIRRKGSTDPDTEIMIENTGMIMEIEQWNVKEEYSVGF